MDTHTLSASVLTAEPRAFEPGLVADYGEAALTALAASRRVFDRLDWWYAREWAASDAFLAMGRRGELVAAMLAAPVLLDDINRLATARSDVAWLRWCAVRNGVSATPLVRRMLEISAAALRRAGARRLMCVVEPTQWLTPYLRDAGFQRVDEVVTLVLRRADWRPGALISHPLIRPADVSDMPAVLAVDHRAFEPHWRMSMQAFARAWDVVSLLLVAEWGGQAAGYVMATRFDDEAHIARLAVAPEQQGRGIGAALLGRALTLLLEDRAVQSVTLNTQAGNTASLALYRRFAFRVARPRLRVLGLDLERAAGGVALP